MRERSLEELIEISGKEKTYVLSGISYLVKKGLIERCGNGKYKLTLMGQTVGRLKGWKI